METKKMVVLAMIAASLSACGTTAQMGGEYLTMTGTPEGWRAGMDGMRSLITEGKSTPDSVSAAWKFRSQQEAEQTNRQANKKSLFDGLFGNSEGK